MSKTILDSHLDDPEWLEKEYNKPRSLQDIANELGVARGTVRKRFTKFGIPCRVRTDHFRDKPKSPEQRAKMSAARKKYWQEHPATDEFREKISKAKRGDNPRRKAPRCVTVDDRGCIHEHRYIAEQMLGRPLRDGEVVHHIDKDAQNNTPGNLLVMTHGEHSSLHNVIRRLKKQGKPVPAHTDILDVLRANSEHD